MTKLQKILTAGASVVSGLFFSLAAKAAADPEITNIATNTATTVAENAKASISAVTPILVAVGALILIIFVAWRLSKRFIGGR